MTRTTAVARPWYFWPLIAFVAGLLIGWIVIGWGVWPVQWTNAMPSDLKSDLQYQYLGMVAESYSVTGDLPTAQQRVESFDEDKLGTTLISLQEYLIDTDARRAGQVQNLIAALRLESTQPVAAAPAAEAPATGANVAPRTSVFRTLLTAVLYAVLVIGGLGLLIWLFLRRKRLEGGLVRDWLAKIRLPRGSSPTTGEIIAAEKGRDVGPTWTGGSVPRRPDFRADAADDAFIALDSERAPKSSSEEWRYAPPGPLDLPPASSVVDSRPRSPVVESRPMPPVTEPRTVPSAVEPPVTPLPQAVEASAPVASYTSQPTPSALPSRIAAFVAVYPDENDPNYYEVFDLKEGDVGPAQQEGLLGQCALAIHRPEGVTSGPTHAFQLWLSDRRDSDYQVRVLMSEGAYRDTFLRSQYTGKLEALPIRLGAEFEMTTRNLILRARVEHLEYDERQEPLHSVISELNVRLIAYRRPTK